MNRAVLKQLIRAALFAVLVVAAAACAPGTAPADGGPLNVVVSILPQKYFLERIGGEHVRVSVMVEPGASPEIYEPKPEQLKRLSGAAAYFRIGLPFEDVWMSKIAGANPNMRIVDTIAAVERLPMEAHGHNEGAGEGEQPEGSLDPHVWVSPALVKIQSAAIYEALVQLDPDNGKEYRRNLDAFMADIDDLEAEIRATLAGTKSLKFMVFHPAWGYFARDFGLEQIAVEIGGQEPSAQELAGLIQEAKQEGIRVVLAQPEFSTADAETIAREIGGEVLLISPLEADWLENMRRVAHTLAEVLNE